MLQELRRALRALARRPSFGIVATATLALGIAATAVVASVLSAVVLRSLPYPEAARLVLVWSRWTAFDKTWLSELELFDYRTESRSLLAVGGWTETAVNLTGGAEPERVSAGMVTADLFPVLATPPLLGRTFSTDEDRPGHDNVVVIGHALWQRRYAGDPAIVGRTIQVNGIARTVVGVMPREFRLPLDFARQEPTQLWLPLAIDAAQASRGSHYLYAAARLAPGEDIERAKAEVAAIAARKVTAGEYPPAMRFEGFAVSLTDEILGPVRPALTLLTAAVALLMLIACANVANLLLVQADARQREMAVRTAIGAGRRALVRQLLVESLLLSSGGAVVGTGLAWVATRLIAAWPLAGIPRLSEIALDWTVLVVTVAATAATGILVGVVPAVRAVRLDVSHALHDGSPAGGSSPARRRFRSVLVVAQIAVAVTLVAAAALVLQSLHALERIDPGFRPDGVLTLRVSLPEASYAEASSVVTFYERLVRRARDLPGVEAAGAVRSLPLADTIGDFGLVIEGLAGDVAPRAKGDWQVATDGYFEAVGERLIEGRWFGPGDGSDAPLVAVVNQTMANLYWPGRDPVGRRLKVGRGQDRPWVTVIGVVGDVRHNGITAPIKEKFYVPHAQWHVATRAPIRSMVLAVRAAGEPESLVAALRREVRALDPQVPLSDVRTLDDVVASTTATPRFAGSILGTFALVALLLAAVGVYGVLSAVVSGRTREIGLRMALGAEPGAIRRMVLRQGILWGTTGAGIGVLTTVAGARLLRGVLYGVSPTDPVTMTGVLAILLAVALLAASVPARRATRVDPLTCLKVE